MRVCLIGATHPCHNPRLVREADALAERGHDVRVIAVRAVPGLIADDEKLVASRRWRLQSASILRSPWPHRLRAVPHRLGRAMAAAKFRRTGSSGAAENALCEAAPQLLRFALAEPADWFVAHTQPVLGVAARAARKWNARLGFDCEDLLAEVDDSAAAMVRSVERAYLPACDSPRSPTNSSSSTCAPGTTACSPPAATSARCTTSRPTWAASATSPPHSPISRATTL